MLQVRDEKAQLNRRVDKLGESLHQRTSQLEELATRLKEFEDGRQAAERRLEAAKHQLEVQEALGPQVLLKRVLRVLIILDWLDHFSQHLLLCFSPTQACSAKSLERLRNQQESLRSLKPQVVYLKDLARGLVQDSPQTAGGSTEGAQRLQMQAEDTEKEYDDVTDKVRIRVVVVAEVY